MISQKVGSIYDKMSKSITGFRSNKQHILNIILLSDIHITVITIRVKLLPRRLRIRYQEPLYDVKKKKKNLIHNKTEERN